VEPITSPELNEAVDYVRLAHDVGVDEGRAQVNVAVELYDLN
jgi:hypothetical protein